MRGGEPAGAGHAGASVRGTHRAAGLHQMAVDCEVRDLNLQQTASAKLQGSNKTPQTPLCPWWEKQFNLLGKADS